MHLKRFKYADTGRGDERCVCVFLYACVFVCMSVSFSLCVSSKIRREKITRIVDFPLQGLDLAPFVPHLRTPSASASASASVSAEAAKTPAPVYDLFAVVVRSFLFCYFICLL